MNPTFDYVKFVDEEHNKTYICAEVRLPTVLKEARIKKHKVLEKFKGSTLEGKSYVPLFDYFLHFKQRNCFTVVGANFVTSDTGTGIVHCAPGFGEDDFNVCV